MKNIFTKHLNEIGETYVQHMGNALKFSFTFLQLAVIAFIHGVLPFCFVNTGSRKVKKLNDLMQSRSDIKC